MLGVDGLLWEAIGVFEVANDRWTAVPPVAIGRVEEARDGESAAREGDHERVVLSSSSLGEEAREQLVIEQVMAPPPPTFAVIINLLDVGPAELAEARREAVGTRVGAGEEVEHPQATGLVGSIGGIRGHVG